MKGVVVLLFVCLIYLARAGRHNAYSGYTVHSIELKNDFHLQVLYDQQVKLDVDVWEYGVPGVRNALVMVSPQNRLKFIDTLDQNDISHYLQISDLVKALEDNDEELAKWKMSRSNSIFQNYPTYAEVDTYLERIAQANPDIVTLVNAGKSFEGRDVKYLKISTSNFTDTSKPIYFLDATIHAREWITTPLALYTIHRLVEDLREDDRDLLDEMDWIVLPIVNPDGYVYSHTDNRLWRRTRSYNATRSIECYGVDGNRNFDFNFEGAGSSTDPCDLTFRGHEPFSEPETRYVRDILLEYFDRIQVYLNVHSHGNLILYGYGDRSYPSNAVHLHLVGSIMGAAIDSKKLIEAPFYVVGNSARVLYMSSGSAQDYGQAVGVPFSFTLELPGMGYGFLIPPSFIDQINMETWEGITESARAAKKLYNLQEKKYPDLENVNSKVLELVYFYVVSMFLSYQVITTFGVSALISFFVSATLLVAMASQRGLLRPQRKEALMPKIYEKSSASELALLTQSN